MNIKKILIFLLVLITGVGKSAGQQSKKREVQSAKWTIEKVNAWYKQQQWIVGANFLPSTAINQLEMWQAESFDPQTIERELGWAAKIGLNTMRVYLHSVAWKQDPDGLKKRMDQYLGIADQHGIKTIFVFFDDCWNKEAKPGKQAAPKPGIHNSGWVQDPGQPGSGDPKNFPDLEKYVKDVLGHFGKDKRILLWDLYNEPGNSDKGNESLPLLKKVFSWARSSGPEQPITSGIWKWDLEELNAFQIQNSDVITYHDYEEPEWHLRVIQMLKTHGRPLICTEYMARTRNSRFSNTLPMLKKENIGAINWGLVAGKSNTIYAWDTPLPQGNQPVEWFHDVFKNDGTPYRQDETDLIRNLTNRDGGKQTKTYTIRNNGMEARFSDCGARLMSLLVPGKNGKQVDVVMGFDDPAAYNSSTEPYFGATIGRYGNRIARGKFSLEGKQYQLTINNGLNTLHGGITGFQYKDWTLVKPADSVLICTLLSPDGDNGFPGNLSVTVVYTLTHKHELQIQYTAVCDQPTVVNLTNHAFFNLNGKGSILNHWMTINADKYTPVDSGLIPTGKLVDVRGTPFDFRSMKTIGSRIDMQDEQLRFGKGYDHNFVLNKNKGAVAEVYGDLSHIVMKIYTSEPGLQFYSGNFMEGKNKLRTGPDHFRTAFALETQHFPDSPNQPSFPSTLLRPSETYKSSTTYSFSVRR
ncbi:aldose epimerase family protein [Pedobacter steynii]|uniref:aldose epimerase family protein n=1 Tax=Pedobacter steynii TaxID=430522 RepID=UPI0009F6E940|nr:aldose epimerase family protein [Pedobacter steynii]